MSKKSLRTLARGQPCQVRLVGVCNFNSETTILAHLREANVAGTGQKPPDTCAVFACNACHDVLDGRAEYPLPIDLADYKDGEIEDMVRGLMLKSDAFDALIRQLAWYDKNEVLTVCL